MTTFFFLRKSLDNIHANFVCLGDNIIICPTLFRTSGLLYLLYNMGTTGLGFHNEECDVKSIKCWIYIYIYMHTHFNALHICWNLDFFFFLKSSILRQENKKNRKIIGFRPQIFKLSPKLSDSSFLILD